MDGSCGPPTEVKPMSMRLPAVHRLRGSMMAMVVAPAVVNITTRTQAVSSIFGGGASGKDVGTGFIVRSDGVIVTNYHVVEGAVSIRVTLPQPDGRSFSAIVIGSDSDHDLAVL